MALGSRAIQERTQITGYSRREAEQMIECKEGCYYSRLGKRRVMKAVWHAIPWQFRPLAFPYCLSVYSRILAQSTSISEVKRLHTNLYSEFILFKLSRPRFRLIKPVLLTMDVQPCEHAIQEDATAGTPVTPELSAQVPIGLESVPALNNKEREGQNFKVRNTYDSASL